MTRVALGPSVAAVALCWVACGDPRPMSDSGSGSSTTSSSLGSSTSTMTDGTQADDTSSDSAGELCGSHATFLPIPLDAAGDRLAGDIETEVQADPEWSVVPGVSLGGLYENGYWTVSGELDFYFIDPAETTITVTDTVSGRAGEHHFVVEPVDHGG